jgi:hypothetical protein
LNTHIDELHKQATKAAFSTSTKGGAAAGNNGAGMVPPTKPLEGVAGFFSALGKVIRRDLGMGKWCYYFNLRVKKEEVGYRTVHL